MATKHTILSNEATENDDSADDVFLQGEPSTSSPVESGSYEPPHTLEVEVNHRSGPSSAAEGISPGVVGTGATSGASTTVEVGKETPGPSYLPSHPTPIDPPDRPTVPPCPISLNDENYERGNWDYKLESLATIVCAVCSVPMLFVFPYMCYRHGGLMFFVPYLLMLFFVGLPILLAEIALGQFISKSFMTMWGFCPLLKGVSYCMMCILIVITVYEAWYLAMLFIYFYYSLTTQKMPWESCDNSWNSKSCTLSFENVWYQNESFVDALYLDPQTSSPVTEFYSFTRNSPEGVNKSIVIASSVVWVLVFLAIFGGMKVVGKLSICFMFFGFCLFVTLAIRGAFLPGSYDGIRYLLFPDISKLLTTEIWVDAFKMVILMTFAGTGLLVSMGSYNRFHNNCFLDAVLVIIVLIFTPAVFSLMVFCYIGYLSHQLNLDLHSVIDFPVVYTTIVESISLVPKRRLFLGIWFMYCIIHIMGSQIVLAQTIVTGILDLFKAKHKMTSLMLVSSIVCCLGFVATILFAIPEDVNEISHLSLKDVPDIVILGSNVGFLIVILIALVWIYGGQQNFNLSRFAKDIQIMVGFFPAAFQWFFVIMWGFVLPLLLGVYWLRTKSYLADYSSFLIWGASVGMFFVFLIIGVIGALHEAYKNRKPYEYCTMVFYKASLPKKDWGPTLDIHRRNAGYPPPDLSPIPHSPWQQREQRPAAHPTHKNDVHGKRPEMNMESDRHHSPDLDATLSNTTPLLGLTLCGNETTL